MTTQDICERLRDRDAMVMGGVAICWRTMQEAADLITSLRLADETRVRDISRLTIERDEAREQIETLTDNLATMKVLFDDAVTEVRRLRSEATTMEWDGWAVFRHGEIDGRTFSNTRRGAIVNWLYVSPDNVYIELLWGQHSATNNATVEPLKLRLAVPPSPTAQEKENEG